MSELHVVFGAGQIGLKVASLLVAAGQRVRVVRRGSALASPAGVEWMAGNLADPAFATRAAAGATVAYLCANVPYQDWARDLPPLQAGVVAGCARAGARLVVLDNLYAYGRPAGRPLTEDRPANPCSRKGELRARLAAELLAADRAGQVRVAIARASDFYGPGVTLAGVFGERLFQRLAAGQGADMAGNPDTRHSYSYGGDVAAGLVALGSRADATGRTWHLPVAPAETSRALLGQLGREYGREVSVSRVPTLVLRLLGLFSPLLREVPEMAYQWEEDFVLDDSAFRAAFPLVPTTHAEGLAATAAWAKVAFAKP